MYPASDRCYLCGTGRSSGNPLTFIGMVMPDGSKVRRCEDRRACGMRAYEIMRGVLDNRLN